MGIPKPSTVQTVTKRSIENEKLTVEELQTWMLKEGISEHELKDLMGVTIQAVRLWLDGRRALSVTTSRLIRLFQKYPQLIREF